MRLIHFNFTKKGLENINENRVVRMYIRNNHLLYDCSFDPICTFINGMKIIDISNNAGNCITDTTLMQACLNTADGCTLLFIK